jgi:hypothetical protein
MMMIKKLLFCSHKNGIILASPLSPLLFSLEIHHRQPLTGRVKRREKLPHNEAIKSSLESVKYTKNNLKFH